MARDEVAGADGFSKCEFQAEAIAVGIDERGGDDGLNGAVSAATANARRQAAPVHGDLQAFEEGGTEDVRDLNLEDALARAIALRLEVEPGLLAEPAEPAALAMLARDLARPT